MVYANHSAVGIELGLGHFLWFYYNWFVEFLT
jgi:hypothetical protein